MKFCGIHLRAIPQEMLKIFILDMSLRIVNLRWQLHLPGAYELASQVQYIYGEKKKSGTPSHKLCLSTLIPCPLIGPTANQLMRKWPGLSETAVHVHHNVWWDLPGNPAKGPSTSLWRQFSVVMTPMQASLGWGISVCGSLNSSVTCGPVVPRQVVCSVVFLPCSKFQYIYGFLGRELPAPGAHLYVFFGVFFIIQIRWKFCFALI